MMDTINLIQNRTNPLVLPVIMADRLELFKKNGVNVNLKIADKFLFNGKVSFVNGDVTANMGDLTFFFYDLAAGKDAILTSDLTRTIQLLVRAEIEDYRNLKIGVARRGLFPFLMEHDFKELLPGAQIVWFDNTYNRIEALKNKDIDGLVAIEPFIQDILDTIPSKVIWKLRESDKNLVMWMFDRMFYQNNKDMVRKFHQTLEESADMFNSQSPEDKVSLAKEIGEYDDKLADRMSQFVFEPQHNYSERDFILMRDFLLKEGKITTKYDPKDRIAHIFD